MHGYNESWREVRSARSARNAEVFHAHRGECAAGGAHRRVASQILQSGEPSTDRTTANVTDILRALGQVFVEVHGGKIEPKVANACAYLASGILQALSVGNFEERIAALEKRHQAMNGGLR